MRGIWQKLLLLRLVFVVVLLCGCQSNAEKIDHFCASLGDAVHRHRGDCVSMGKSLEEVIRESEGVKVYGLVKLEEESLLLEGCREGIRQALGECSHDLGVKSALSKMPRSTLLKEERLESFIEP